MAFPTQPVFVHKSNDWDETTRKHPALAWFEKLTKNYDANGPSWEGWLTDDLVYQRSDGTQHHGREGFEEWKRSYDAFAGVSNIPYSFYCVETDYGYEFLTQTRTYVNCRGNPVAGEKKVTNPNNGEEWDALLLCAFRFEIKKVGDDFRVQRSEAHINLAPAISVMMARGVKLG